MKTPLELLAADPSVNPAYLAALVDAGAVLVDAVPSTLTPPGYISEAAFKQHDEIMRRTISRLYARINEAMDELRDYVDVNDGDDTGTYVVPNWAMRVTQILEGEGER